VFRGLVPKQDSFSVATVYTLNVSSNKSIYVYIYIHMYIYIYIHTYPRTAKFNHRILPNLSSPVQGQVVLGFLRVGLQPVSTYFCRPTG
jgi:hypothetical protein